MQDCIVAWTSLPVGVVTLAERYGGKDVDAGVYERMVCHVDALLQPFEMARRLREQMGSLSTHLLGTSGTVTTVAGIHLGLPRYDRTQVDGCWLDVAHARAVASQLLSLSYAQRVAQPCIGFERAEFVLAGCAILEAVIKAWPCGRLRVADRGLREGILATLMAEDGAHGPARNRPYYR
jgi:exopolyphosphatase/guanosine-5'-triphosphate,3'-diphosphate pyrophosphatase